MTDRDWREMLTDAAHRSAVEVERRFDELRAGLRDRLGRTDPLMIQAYRGFGSTDEVLVWGRVLEDDGRRDVSDRDTVWQNLVASYKRFETDEVPGARVVARFAGAEAEAVTDDEGYFEIRLRPAVPIPTDAAWHTVALELTEPAADAPVHDTGEVLLPAPSAQFGVISDIDDTVLRTDATNLLQTVRLTFLRNAHTRTPFEGVAELYRALEGEAGNPFFYVSSSPWNLYDFMVDFFELNDLPAGPFLLRDMGIDASKFIVGSHDDHKLAQIERVLAAYPELPFVLIGDSGQHDPEIYRQAIADFPGRVRAAYIRDVSMGDRETEVVEIAAEVTAGGVDMVLVADSHAALDHARSIGLA